MNSFMLQVIPSDFAVKLLFEDDESALFGANKGGVTHLVFYGGNAISQEYVHRHEWANFLLEGESLKIFSEIFCKTLASRLYVELNPEKSTLLIKKKGFNCELNLKKTPFGKQLLKDAKTLSNVRNNLEKEEYRNEVLAYIQMEEEPSDLTDLEFELAAFEFEIFKGVKRRYPQLKNVIGQRNHHIEYFDDFLYKAKFVVDNDSCDCGSETCFFDLLNKTFLHFFKSKKKFLSEGTFDLKKGEKEFKSFWKRISPQERAVLAYLDFSLRNTPLVNMALLLPNFNLYEYLSPMTSIYQPDSDEEAHVRINATICHYYIHLFQNKN